MIGRRIRRAAALVALGGAAIVGGADTASGHGQASCYHGDWTGAGWIVEYIDHYWEGSRHYNIYHHTYALTDQSHVYIRQCGG